MQTTNEPSTITAASQQAVVDRSQLTPGTIITGVAWRTARIIEEIDGNVAILIKYPRPQLAVGHIHALTAHNNCECECGYRREPLAGLLPLREGMVRTFAIIPTGPLLTPDEFTGYMGTRGRQFRMVAGQWTVRGGSVGTNSIPLIPKLHAVWTIPPGLRRLLAGGR